MLHTSGAMKTRNWQVEWEKSKESTDEGKNGK